MPRILPAAIDEDVDLSHVFLARTAQPSDESTDVPYFPDDDDNDPRLTWWGETVELAARDLYA